MKFVDIKNAENLDIMPSDIKDQGLKHAYEDADKHLWTKDELAAYDYAAMRRQDERGKAEVAVKRAYQKGADDKMIEAAKEMILENYTIEQIAKITKLSIPIIERIINEIKRK